MSIRSGIWELRSLWPTRKHDNEQTRTQSKEPAVAQRTIKIFWEHLKRYPRSLTALFSLLPAVLIIQSGLLPLLYSRTIDQLNSNTASGNLTNLIMVFLGLHILVFVGQRIISAASSNLEFKVIRDIEQRIFNWLLLQSHSFHSSNHGGALVAQAKRFTGAYSGLYTAFYFNIMSLFLRFMVAIIFLAFMAPPIAAILGVWTIIYLSLIIYLTIQKSHMSRAASAADSHVTAQLSDTIVNSMVVRMFGQESIEAARYADMSIDKYAKRKHDWRYSEIIIGTQSLLMIALETIVLYYSVMLVQNGTFTLGRLALIQFFLGPILISLWDIGRVVRQVESSLADASEMTQILTRIPEVRDPESPEAEKITRGDIRFKHIDFSYTDTNAYTRQIFEDFNLHIKPGERVGVVGPSGSGKSTLSKLLLRFMDASAGQVVIDNQDISTLKQIDLRKRIAYVPQEPLLFHRSIRDNIRYGQPSATDREIIAAAKQACAHDFIEALPASYDTMVGERGSKLSGGERQHIAIARAVLKQAPILLLDEATSALDSESEALIQEALWRLMEGRTAIVIAHRLSTIQKMDRILVMDKGKIAEQGTHKELIRQNGIYAGLWERQSGGI